MIVPLTTISVINYEQHLKNETLYLYSPEREQNHEGDMKMTGVYGCISFWKTGGWYSLTYIH